MCVYFYVVGMRRVGMCTFAYYAHQCRQSTYHETNINTDEAAQPALSPYPYLFLNDQPPTYLPIPTNPNKQDQDQTPTHLPPATHTDEAAQPALQAGDRRAVHHRQLHRHGEGARGPAPLQGTKSFVSVRVLFFGGGGVDCPMSTPRHEVVLFFNV